MVDLSGAGGSQGKRIEEGRNIKAANFSDKRLFYQEKPLSGE
jgi:hypothetical protein